MTSFGSRFKKLRKEKNLTQDKLAEKFFLQKSSISKYENNVHIPEIDVLQKFADFFEVSIDYLLGRSDYRTLFPKDTIEIEGFVKLPVLKVIRAGEPLYAEQNIADWEYVAKNNLPSGECFFLKVIGDSMNLSRIEEGDIVLIRKQEEVENGQVAVVIVNGEEGTIKRFYRDGQMVTLMPNSTNSGHAPRTINTKDVPVKVVGKVVQALIKF